MERKSSLVLIIAWFSVLLFPSELSGQQKEGLDNTKNIYVVDTIIMQNPISVLYNYKGREVGLFIEKSKLNLIKNSKINVIQNDYVYLSESGFLEGDYPKYNCEMGETFNDNGFIYQEFKDKPDYFILLLVRIENYVKTQSSTDNYLGKFFPKDSKELYVKVLVPIKNKLF